MLAEPRRVFYGFPMTDFNASLAGFRQKIDALDDQLIALLIERIGVIGQVGAMKRQAQPGQCPLRAGREAEMVRRVVKKFEGSGFSPVAAAAMWRLLIGASTAVEGALKLSVYAPDQDRDLFWLAREYFGPSIPAVRHPVIQRVIGDVMDKKAAIGIVPLPTHADTPPWWASLIQRGKEIPRIFAHIPFVHHGAPGRDAPSALAIGYIEPEESGDDVSLLVVEADHNASQHRLQTAFAKAKLEVRWIHIAALNPASRHHLVEIKGFVTPAHAGMASVVSDLGDAAKSVHFLGAYAVPIILKPERETDSHVQRAAT